MPPFPKNGLAVVGLRTSRLAETAHFYRDVIGLPGLPGHGHRPAFDLGHGTSLVIVEAPSGAMPAAPEPHFPILAFAVEDLDGAIARLQAHHVDLPWGVQGNSQARWVEFYDPGGNLVEYAQFAG